MGWLIGIGVGIWITVFLFGGAIHARLCKVGERKAPKYRVRVIPSMLSLMNHGVNPFPMNTYTVELPEIPTEGDAVVTGQGKDRLAHIVGPSIVWSRVDDAKEYTAFIVAKESIPMDIEALTNSLADSVDGPLNKAAKDETDEQSTDTDIPTPSEHVPPEEEGEQDHGV